jgi:hypothetical protein
VIRDLYRALDVSTPQKTRYLQKSFGISFRDSYILARNELILQFSCRVKRTDTLCVRVNLSILRDILPECIITLSLFIVFHSRHKKLGKLWGELDRSINLRDVESSGSHEYIISRKIRNQIFPLPYSCTRMVERDKFTNGL